MRDHHFQGGGIIGQDYGRIGNGKSRHEPYRNKIKTTKNSDLSTQLWRAADLETTFQTLSSILPESVAVIDQDIGGFQDLRPMATLALPVIKGEGRGLVTYDRGLGVRQSDI